MINTITATILGAKRYDINGEKMASLFLSQQVVEEPNGDSVGLEVMKVSCPYSLIDVLRNEKLPGEFEIQVNMKAAGGGKLALVATAVRPVNGGAPKTTKVGSV